MILPLLTLSVMAAEGYFLPPLHPAAQPSAIRGHAQGNEFYPEYNKIEQNLNYNNRFLYQSPHYQHFADSQRYYSQAAAQQAYGPPFQQIYQQQQQQQQQQPKLQEPLIEPVYSDIRDSPIYIQPHDEETTRQQTLTVNPQYLNLPSQSQQDVIPQYSGQPQVNLRGPQGVQGLQTTAQTTIPVLVKVSDNQALIVPVRAVYALPGFLERLVQRVQGYYSVYNPIEHLVVDKPYYVPTGGSAVQPVDVSAVADPGVQPVKADLVEEPSQGPSEPDAAAIPAAIDVKFSDLKQEEIKDETTTASQVEEEKETATELTTEESKDSTEKDGDNVTEASESSDATTVPSSSDDSPSSTESASVSSTSQQPSTTTKPEDKPQDTSSVEDNSATSDLDSAGYTYYRPAVPFYYPSQ